MPAFLRTATAFLGLVVVAGSVARSGLRADDRDQLKVGRQPDGSILVPTNQLLRPAGRQIEFPGRPVDLALTDSGRTLVVKNLKDLVFIDVASGATRQTLAAPVGFSVVGLLAAEGRVYVTDVRDHIRVAVSDAEGRYAWTDPVKLAAPLIGGAAHPAGLAWQSAGKVWVASTRGNNVQLIDLASGKVEQVVNVGVAPYAISCPDPATCLVSNWGGDRPQADDTKAPSSGTPTHVDARGIADRGTVSLLKAENGRWRQTRTVQVGLHPSGLVASRDGRLVYVANANSDTVSVVRTADGAVVETINCRPEGRLPFGSGCNALALSPGGETLYVANGTNNCVAVVRPGSISSAPGEGRLPNSRLVGLIPTGWYPGALGLTADGKALLVANIKGVGSLSRQRAADKSPRPVDKGMNSHDHLGSVSVIDVPSDRQLTEHTAVVNANNRLAYSLAGLAGPRPGAKPAPIPERHGEPSVFQHVVYVIKENRTYDQVFGDVKEGNGDPQLTIFGAEATPNHHKLAREFTLFDNFYCSGVLSADGHQWVNEAYVTDYLERQFGGFTRSYPYEGSDPLAFAASGFLWDNAVARQKSFRNFGEYVKPAAPKGATWADMYAEAQTGAGKFKPEAKVNVAALGPHTQPNYPGFVLSIPDVYRARLFVEELRACEKKGVFPNLVYLYLPCDHTAGTRPGQPTPRAMAADNDLALGRVIEALSRSKFWQDTCIFVVEDDPQNGFDHVDAHRTVALAISPYTRRNSVDSTCYNQTGMVKTIELVLGLPPMNQLDLSATAMRACFREVPDLTPYTATPNRVALDEMNPPLAKLTGPALHWAKKSLELDLDDADLADEDTLNRILWHSIRGADASYPEQSAGRRQPEP